MTEKLKAIFAPYVNGNLDQISLDADLRGDLGLTSLDLVDMAVSLEEAYGVQITDLSIVNTKTVRDILKLLDNK